MWFTAAQMVYEGYDGIASRPEPLIDEKTGWVVEFVLNKNIEFDIFQYLKQTWGEIVL